MITASRSDTLLSGALRDGCRTSNRHGTARCGSPPQSALPYRRTHLRVRQVRVRQKRRVSKVRQNGGAAVTHEKLEALRSALAISIQHLFFEARAAGMPVREIEKINIGIARQLAGLDENDGWVRSLNTAAPSAEGMR